MSEFEIINANIKVKEYSMSPSAIAMRAYKEDPEKRKRINEKKRLYAQQPKHREWERSHRHKNMNKFLYYAAKERAKKKNLEFIITFSDVIVPDICPVLGIQIICGSSRQNDNSPTLDRIDSSKGYIPGNVAVISWRANNIKRDGTAEEHIAIAKYISGARG